MTLKDALYRELRYGSVLDAFFSGDSDKRKKIKLDVRIEPDAQQAESAYPYVIFRRINHEVDDHTGMVKDTVELELIGRISSTTKGDDLLEAMKDALITEFGGHRKTWGKYDASGNADPNGGLKITARHLDSNDSFDELLDEKIQALTFLFAYVQ